MTLPDRIGSRWSRDYGKDARIPLVKFIYISNRADRRPPQIQRRYGHPRPADASEQTADVIGPEPAMAYVCRVVWGMTNVDDACIVRDRRGGSLRRWNSW